jgi:hypothetical protein
MDLAFDNRGTMYGASMFGLFTIDRKTGTATKVVDFVGGGVVMGLGYNAKQDKLYATDWKAPKSALYVVDTKNGFLTPMADIGFPLSHGLETAVISRVEIQPDGSPLGAARYATISRHTGRVR